MFLKVVWAISLIKWGRRENRCLIFELIIFLSYAGRLNKYLLQLCSRFIEIQLLIVFIGVGEISQICKILYFMMVTYWAVDTGWYKNDFLALPRLRYLTHSFRNYVYCATCSLTAWIDSDNEGQNLWEKDLAFFCSFWLFAYSTNWNL